MLLEISDSLLMQRERRHTFFETHRLPKHLRQRLTRQQLDSIVPCRSRLISTQPSPQASQLTGGYRVRECHNTRRRRTPIKLERKPHTTEKQSNYREMTLLDITVPLNKGLLKTVEDNYKVSQDSSGAVTPDDASERDSATEVSLNNSESGLIILNSDTQTLDAESNTCTPNKLKPANQRLSQSKRWRSVYQPPSTSPTTQSTVHSDQLPPPALILNTSYQLTADKCKLQTVDRQIPSKPATLKRDIKTVPLTGKQDLLSTNSSEKGEIPDPNIKPARVQSTRCRRRSANGINKPSILTFSNGSQDMEFIEENKNAESTEVFSRKPVIPSLTQLTQVMSNSWRAHDASPTSPTSHHEDSRLYQSPGYKNHLINKYHGTQIVVDSTNYDDFARKK